MGGLLTKQLMKKEKWGIGTMTVNDKILKELRIRWGFWFVAFIICFGVAYALVVVKH